MATASAPRSARALARAELTRAILESASRQLAEIGPAALSVRAVARDLGMASSAVYRYFASRDDLLTALLIRAYDDVGQAVEDGDAAVADRADLAGRFRAVARALRGWAREHPHEYALLYGSPVPGYAAPTDTVDSATRVPRTLLALVRDAQLADVPLPVTVVSISAEEAAAVAPIQAFTDPPLDLDRTVRALQVWATLFGHLSLELFGHMHNAVLDYDAHFAHVVDQLATDMGLPG